MYEDITSGTLSEALQFLVPYPTDHENYDPVKQTEEEVWGKITEALEKKYILTCSSRDDK